MQRVRRALAAAFRPLRGRDVALHAAAVTFYAGIAVVPAALLTVWLAGLAAGPDRVRAMLTPTLTALPDAIGAAHALDRLVEAGLGLTPVLALVSLLPATFYGEGLRRAFLSVAAKEESMAGWRGRILWVPLLAALPLLLLGLLWVLPTASGLWTRGGWSAVLAVLVSFFATWITLSPAVIWIYRAVAPGHPDWLATTLVGSFTAANLSGFLHGFVLFSALPLDLGAPFGGFTEVGGVVAVGLWLYLLHVILIAGYAATRTATHFRRDRATAATRPEPEATPAQEDLFLG